MDLSVDGILNHTMILPQTRPEPRWTIDDSFLLFDVLEQVSHGSYNVDDYDWNRVGNKLNRSPHECRMWFEFLKVVMNMLPYEDRSDNRPKRKRRKAGQISKLFKCQVNSCPKVYGTEGALKFHMKNKHKDIKYIPSYLYQYNNQPITNHHQHHHKPSQTMIFPDGILFKAEPGMVPTFVIPSSIGHGHLMSGMIGGHLDHSLSLMKYNNSPELNDDISSQNNISDEEEEYSE